MELTGKIINILPVITGDGKNGTWKKREYILETSLLPPRMVCFSVWGDKIDQFDLHSHEKVEVSINIESRQNNGRWYTEVRAWKVKKINESEGLKPENDDTGKIISDDLPF